MADTIKIYTDGAARGNPGPAGWAAVFLMDGKVFELGGGAGHATNNQMELTAAIEALKYFKKLSRGTLDNLQIVSDSKYVILGITEWLPNWLKNNWRTAAKKPVLNQALWQELESLNRELKPKWTYIAGHMGHEHNERADVIATSFADNMPVELKKQ